MWPDLAQAADFIGEMQRLCGGAFAADAEAFRRAATTAGARDAAFALAVIAGLSEVVGQSIVLFVNRVPLYRVTISLVLTALLFPLMAVVWTASALVFARIADPALDMAQWASIGDIAGVVALAFAPRLFGVLSIAPYIGPGIGRVLDLWVMALVIFGLQTALDAPLAAAATAGALGWLAQYLLRRLLGRALRRPLRWLRIAVTGSPLDKSPQALIDELLHPERRSVRR